MLENMFPRGSNNAPAVVRNWSDDIQRRNWAANWILNWNYILQSISSELFLGHIGLEELFNFRMTCAPNNRDQIAGVFDTIKHKFKLP